MSYCASETMSPEVTRCDMIETKTSGDTSKRSSFNIYKRACVQRTTKVGQTINESCPDNNTRPKKMQAFVGTKTKMSDISDTQMIHAPSQSTLNLNERCPLVFQQTSNAGFEDAKTDIRMNSKGLVTLSVSRSAAFLSSCNTSGNKIPSAAESTTQSIQQRPCEDSYIDYINNGSCFEAKSSQAKIITVNAG